MSLLTKILIAPLILLAALIALPLLAVVFVCWFISSTALATAVAILWIPRKIRYLIIYSDSAQWKSYFEEEVIPSFDQNAKVINLSRDGGRKKWWHLDWILYRHCAGYRNRFPIVIRLSPFGTWRAVRFYDAFIQAKKGKNQSLDNAKATLNSWSYENGA